MPEIRIEVDIQETAVLDGYCSATGKSRTSVILSLIKTFSDQKLHEAETIMRVVGPGRNPTKPD